MRKSFLSGGITVFADIGEDYFLTIELNEAQLADWHPLPISLRNQTPAASSSVRRVTTPLMLKPFAVTLGMSFSMLGVRSPATIYCNDNGRTLVVPCWNSQLADQLRGLRVQCCSAEV